MESFQKLVIEVKTKEEDIMHKSKDVKALQEQVFSLVSSLVFAWVAHLGAFLGKTSHLPEIARKLEPNFSSFVEGA